MFRRVVVRGVEEFWTAGATASPQGYETGRAWLAAELRNKSFDDLHKLWYVCLKERNLLETEKHFCRTSRQEFKMPERLEKVKTTMARIKGVIGERQRAGEVLPNVKPPVK